MIARLLYSLVWHLALPLVLFRLWWRGRREPGYRRHLGERLGFYRSSSELPSRRLIWVHAVSVGETRAAEPLVRSLLASHPDRAILLTHMTPTGRATGAAVFSDVKDRVVQCYLPYDLGWLLVRFLRRYRPLLCILMETEVWPNLIEQCRRAGVPVTLVNARLSERSLRRARRLAALMLPAARAITRVAAQTEADAKRILSLGVADVAVAGSIKFDVKVPSAMLEAGQALRASWQASRALLCASTRAGEEERLLDAWATVESDVLLVLVPRHPQRFDEVERLITRRGYRAWRRSHPPPRPPDPARDVVLGDTMGEMFAYFSACDAAFIGGSLLPLGGQNLIEACALGKPVLVGPHTFNFALVTEEAVASGAALRVSDAADLLTSADRLLHSPEELASRGKAAREFATRHRGATARTVALIEPLLSRAD